MYKLVLLRHGQSQWNLENRFTGWVDIDLSEQGHKEAIAAGKLLRAEDFQFDVAYTSVLKRAIRTLWSCLSELDQMWLPTIRSWRLNERHYGKLQGLNKAETVAEFGEEKVFSWRRSYAIPPPELDPADPGHPKHDRRYNNIDGELPNSEALLQTKERVLPFWESNIAPDIRAGKNVFVVAHGNSLRALIKHLDHISDEDIPQLNIPTGIPLVYELDKDLKPIKHYYLGDPEAAKKAAEAVKEQAGKF